MKIKEILKGLKEEELEKKKIRRRCNTKMENLMISNHRISMGFARVYIYTYIFIYTLWIWC